MIDFNQTRNYGEVELLVTNICFYESGVYHKWVRIIRQQLTADLLSQAHIVICGNRSLWFTFTMSKLIQRIFYES